MARLSVISAIYNEERNVSDLYLDIIEAMRDRIENYEIVFVNDGSRDGSSRQLTEIAQYDPRVKVIHLDRNYGLAAAIWAGIRHSDGDLIALMDAGLQTDPRDIFRLMPFIERLDCVNGRWNDIQESWIQRLSYRAGNEIRRRIARGKLQDSACPLKLFRREVADNLVFFKGMHRFISTMAQMNGFSVIEVSVRYRKRRNGGSRPHVLKNIFAGCSDAIVVRCLSKRVVRYKVRKVQQFSN
ncbi:glycosyltransferase family 2 protein [Paenibacillus sp. MBLB2552]|uniref:Glycosyltransferase family 2 protein n=1 Tax=Paenibacillus mellifer TaxID=2937794 RepID=A0A9X1Y267_9BACL|nr:glycosyltransferase family 2 protein [Paenibacillus mellifer]MCK8487958.1 glycosyltransferase family 2 protein [Paenibacillus mellifer]